MDDTGIVTSYPEALSWNLSGGSEEHFLTVFCVCVCVFLVPNTINVATHKQLTVETLEQASCNGHCEVRSDTCHSVGWGK